MKIAIAGYGQEGESSYRYYSSDPSNNITIVDQKQPNRELPAGVTTIIDDKAFEILNGFDLVIRTAGLAIDKIKTDGKIWSSTNEFFVKCPAKIIGVTGTKGKGTTASLIAGIFEAAGKKVWLLGNIGVTPLDFLSQIKPDDIVVYELSSFQLWDLERSPHVAVALLVEPEHLDVHRDFDDYVNAKANIRRYQVSGDVCIFHPTNEYSRKIAESSNQSRAIRYGISDDGGVYTKDGAFYQNEHKICSTDNLQLIGLHNIENACAAITVSKCYGIADEVIVSGLKSFQGLPHRLEYVREINGVKYYNDSFSSSTPATVAAIRSFSQPEILIMGGIDRGGNFKEIADTISVYNNVKAIIVIGEIRDKLVRILSDINPSVQIEATDLESMSAIVDLAKSYSQSGDVVVLSPGCASFDMFKNFYDRGDKFRDAVNSLTSKFTFDSYEFDKSSSTVNFRYSFDDATKFVETIKFEVVDNYDDEILNRALFLAFVLIGTSYYKSFPSTDIVLNMPIDDWQATFFSTVYQEGLGQFAFENHLTRDNLARFKATSSVSVASSKYNGSGIIALQSGGKDSLLTATLLKKHNQDFASWYVSSGSYHPAMLDKIGSKLLTSVRSIDRDSLQNALKKGAKNGHVPVTYILQSLAVIQSILTNNSDVLVSIAHEGEEPHDYIGDLAVTHQWSKTWTAEKLFSEYISRYISPDLRIGSPLRCYSELRVAELFVENSWAEYGHKFSSCNIANYKQGNDNSDLKWCGDCPKCANSYLLFAPFLAADELKDIFNGQDLFAKPSLQQTFKGLLGVDGIMKPFECVGEIEELRLAYHLAHKRGGYQPLSFDVLESSFDYKQLYPAQDWAVKMLQ
jgi:UDP-N-acetylmuramoylalanine--D-glutamate ligase